MAFIFFEGVDKVGKSTLLRAVDKATDYTHFCIDRCLGSAYVYDLVTGRRNRFEELTSIEKEFASIKSIPMITVLLVCDRDTLVKRIKEEDEFPEKRIEFLDKAIKAYEQYQQVTTMPILIVDTTNKSIDDTVSEIIIKIKKYEK